MDLDAIDILIDDHKKLISVMNKLEKEIDKNKSDYASLFQDFKKLFKMHDEAEDEIIYPALKEFSDLERLVLKGYQAHHMVEVGILELRATPYTSETWGPKLLVVKDSILAHMAEEEQLLFPAAKNHLDKSTLRKLGKEVRERRD